MTDLITHIRSIRSDDQPMLRSSWSAYRTPPSPRLETDDGPGLRYAMPLIVLYPGRVRYFGAWNGAFVLRSRAKSNHIFCNRTKWYATKMIPPRRSACDTLTGGGVHLQA